MVKVKEHLAWLGFRVQDKITGFKGVATSVSFDLYGCMQVLINPGLQKDDKLGDQMWFDASRLQVLAKKPVMDVPEFDLGGEKGAAEKPLTRTH